ncbi:AI-2E family transporter [Candidatus Pacearchaeota archaeon]|nr:AI-2E family transporter [Candidatus Pacearchaeota archaeon]
MKPTIYNIILAGIISFVLIAMLIYGSWPFIGAFFGAIIFYVLLYPLHTTLVARWSWNKRASALFLIIASFLAIALPAVLITKLVYSEFSELVIERDLFSQGVVYLGNVFPELHLEKVLDNPFALGIGTGDFAANLLKGIAHLFVSLFIMAFIIYYLLVENDIGKTLAKTLPFDEKETVRLINEFKNVTYTTVIVSGLLALFQGFLVALGFFVAGIKGAVLWGFVAAILAFIPVLGTPLVWGPAVVIQFMQNNYGVAFGLLIWGIFLSNIDNFIRPYLQKRVGDIHPLLTTLGIFIGIYLFGLVGIVVGPLLISYSFLTLRMFQNKMEQKT